jgi:hypothetical protein
MQPYDVIGDGGACRRDLDWFSEVERRGSRAACIRSMT